MKRWKSWSCLVVGLFSLNAMAEGYSVKQWFAEPFVGWNLADYKQDFPHTSGATADNTDAKFGGLGFGVRAGINFGRNYFAGVDFTYGMRKMEGTATTLAGTSSTAISFDFTQMSVGPMFGLFLEGTPVRVFASYLILNEYKEGSNGTKGMGVKLGAGWTIVPRYLSLNVEYILQMMSKDLATGSEYPFSSTNSLGPGTSEKPTFNTIFISASMPFDFGKPKGGGK